MSIRCKTLRMEDRINSRCSILLWRGEMRRVGTLIFKGRSGGGSRYNGDVRQSILPDLDLKRCKLLSYFSLWYTFFTFDFSHKLSHIIDSFAPDLLLLLQNVPLVIERIGSVQRIPHLFLPIIILPERGVPSGKDQLVDLPSIIRRPIGQSRSGLSTLSVGIGKVSKVQPLVSLDL